MVPIPSIRAIVMSRSIWFSSSKSQANPTFKFPLLKSMLEGIAG